MRDNATTPAILLLVFNRPHATARVLQNIKTAAPGKLFIAADGARPGNFDDESKCAAVRELIRTGVDWDCDVSYLEREKNLGCGRAPSSGISWFFDHVSEGIILEDDCLPSPSFFTFCARMLARYRDEPRIAHVGGFNCQFGRTRGNASYYFSRYFHSWGWATWQRAWQDFNFELTDYQQFLTDGVLESLFERRSVREFWKSNFDAVFSGRRDIWDYQWVYCNFKKDRLAVVPNTNMIENIGFGAEATHTVKLVVSMPLLALAPPQEIVHPRYIIPCRAADDFTYRHHLGLGLFHDMKQLIKRAVMRRHVVLGALPAVRPRFGK